MKITAIRTNNPVANALYFLSCFLFASSFIFSNLVNLVMKFILINFVKTIKFITLKVKI
jgi:hypothetical protein